MQSLSLIRFSHSFQPAQRDLLEPARLFPSVFKAEMHFVCYRHSTRFAHYASELREDSFKAETLALDEGTYVFLNFDSNFWLIFGKL